jgi:hypothetical protein
MARYLRIKKEESGCRVTAAPWGIDEKHDHLNIGFT